jgi:WD40 repeat protein
MVRRWARGWITLLVAAVGLPWLPALNAPPGDLPMQRARGDAGAPVVSLALSPDGHTIAATDEHGRVRLRPIVAGAGLDRDLDIRSYAKVASFSPDGRYLAVGGDGADVVLCDLVRGGPGRLLEIPVRETKDLPFSPDGRTLAVSNHRSREIILWDVEKGRRRMTLPGHTTHVIGLAFAPDGQSLTSVGLLDPVVRVWDLATERPRHVVTERSSISGGLSPDGRLLAAANADLTVIGLWDLRSGRLVRRIAGLPSPIRSVAFSPDGGLLAMGAADHFVSLWSVATGLELRRLDARTNMIRHVTFSPDGRTLAAAGNDDDIRLWDLNGLRDRESLDSP